MRHTSSLASSFGRSRLAVRIAVPVFLVALVAAPAPLSADPCKVAAVAARMAGGSVHEMAYDEWLRVTDEAAEVYLDRNLSPPEGKPGAVMAAPLGPGHGTANYRRVWIRDQALVMASKVAEIADPRTPPVRRRELLQQVKDFVGFTRDVQNTATRTGSVESGDNLGEALVGINGEMLHENWGNPQNDGPAIRARTNIEFAKALLATPEGKALAEQLLAKVDGRSIIDRDVEYTMKHWSEKSFDLWEEELGFHLDVLGKQAAALIAREQLAKLRGEPAGEYGKTAAKILARIEELSFWNGKYLEATRGVPDGHGLGKMENLDIAPIMMANHTGGVLADFGPSSPRILATAFALKSRFKELYKVNRENEDPEVGVLIGRYPEDTWDGMSRGGRGYGWGIATMAMGELAYNARTAFLRAGRIEVTSENIGYLRDVLRSHGDKTTTISAGQTLDAASPAFKAIIASLLKEGDAYMRRVKRHSHANGEMNEGMNPDSGYMQGPANLTWNYAAAKTALRARADSLEAGGP